jgi:uncharacterized protein
MYDSNHMDDKYQTLYAFLEKSYSYPHNPMSVEHVQTHISHVFIAPPFVYKFKKPVDFGFLDYSTLEKRKYFCEQEVELNRRLCPEIYVGVVTVIKGEQGFEMEPVSDDEEAIEEYAVKMKMLEEKYFLHSYIKAATLTNHHLDRVTDTLADFYLKQTPGDEITAYGRIDKIRFNTDENFQQTEAFVGNTISRDEFEAIKYFTNQYYDRNDSLFQRRVEEKRIVDGHGDLHLEHIHVSPGSICIYDCIEFNERLRCGDQAADLAFLAMDLDFYGCRGESRYFVDQMARKLNDPDLGVIIDFYKCYRAYVKGKVKSLQSAEDEVAADDRENARKKASVYFHLALRYALLGSRPVVLICMGRVGTGKSTLANHLSSTLTIESFSSDRVRKQLAGFPIYERPGPEKREELYSAEMSDKTYRFLLENAKEQLRMGRSVILDATYSLRSGRIELEKELEEMGADYLFIEAKAPDETVKARLKSREGKHETESDARVEDFAMLYERYQPPEEIDSRHRIEVNTGTELSRTIHMLYKKLIDRQVDRTD